jgi:transposase-like protein
VLALLRDRPLESLLCPNGKCRSNHGDRQKGLKVRYWRGNGTIRYLHCYDCGAELSERQGTPLFNLRVTEQKAFDVLNHLGEGCGIRGTSRLCGVQEETVIRLQRLCGEHFKRWHDSRV